MRKTAITLAIAGGALALAACASQPRGKGQQVTQQKKTHMVCFSATPIGSLIPKTTCMTEANYASYKKQQEKKDKQERSQFRQLGTQGSQTGGKGGGGGGS